MTSEVQISKIVVSGLNPRKHFDPDELKELQASIEQYGILEPLIVRSINSHYELVAGERRLRAATAAGLRKVPVVIRALTDAEVHEIMLIENLQRSQLAPLEEAQSIQVLLQDGIITQEDLARKLGKSQAWVANRLRLLAAPEELKDLLISRKITPKHVIAALPYAQYPVMEAIIDGLKGELKEESSCSVTKLQDIIENKVQGHYQNDYVLDLDDFPYNQHHIRPYVDLSKCHGCSHIVEFQTYNDSYHRYCLQRKCWKALLLAAQDKFTAERSNTVDTSLLEHGAYTRLYSSDFDTSVCHACEKCKSDTFGKLICLDPKCYTKKKTAAAKESNKAARAERDRVWAAIDAWIDSGQLIETRWVLKSLIVYGPSDPTIKGLSRWGKLKTLYGSDSDVDALLDQLSDEDLWKAVVRIISAHLMSRGPDTIGELQANIPAAAEFLEVLA